MKIGAPKNPSASPNTHLPFIISIFSTWFMQNWIWQSKFDRIIARIILWFTFSISLFGIKGSSLDSGLWKPQYSFSSNRFCFFNQLGAWLLQFFMFSVFTSLGSVPELGNRGKWQSQGQKSQEKWRVSVRWFQFPKVICNFACLEALVGSWNCFYKYTQICIEPYIFFLGSIFAIFQLRGDSKSVTSPIIWKRVGYVT